MNDEKMEKDVAEFNYKIRVFFTAIAQKRFFRILGYFMSINLILGIINYFIFRKIDRKFAKTCLIISLIVVAIFILQVVHNFA